MTISDINTNELDYGGLRENIKQKYSDAKLLFLNGGYANCYYLCGYCVELALKYKIAKYLKWLSFTPLREEKNLKCHDLNHLLRYTGLHNLTMTPDWNVVKDWSESIRYANPSLISKQSADEMLKSTKVVVRGIYKCLLKP